MMQKPFAVLFAILLSITLLLGILYFQATNAPLMARRFKTFSTVSLTEDEASQMAIDITSYLRNEQAALPMFQQHEQQHMQDVQDLISLLQQVLLFLLFSLFFLFPFAAKNIRPVRYTLLAVLTVVLLVILYGLFDFDGLFIAFHRIAFTNDLWLLNPYTDLLIQLMPTAFFVAYALSIGLIWLFFMGLLVGLCHLMERKNTRELHSKQS